MNIPRLIADSAPASQLTPVPAATTHCRHCGTALLSVRESESGFCCTGCAAVYDFVHSLGLEGFYGRRAPHESPLSQKNMKSTSSYDYFDDPQFQTRFCKEQASGTLELSLHLSGIHCASCVWLLEQLPQAVPGLGEVRVDFLRSRVRVRFDSTSLSASKVARIFSRLGYEPHPLEDHTKDSVGFLGDRAFASQLGIAAFSAMNVMLLFICRYQGLFSGIEEQYTTFFAWTSLLLSIPSVTFAAFPFYRGAFGSLRYGKLHLDTPIAIAIIGGFVASTLNTILGRPEIYFDTVTTLIFLLLCGRWCQRHALQRVGIESDILHAITPLNAVRISALGERNEVYVRALRAGDTVVVAHDAVIPCDGIVQSRSGYVSNSVLTGESKPVCVLDGTVVWAGAKNVGEELLLSVTATGTDTKIGRILVDVQNAPTHHSRIARLVDRIGGYFVIAILVLAAITCALWIHAGFAVAWDHVIALLVVSCPCALGIVVPVTLSLASARAARAGILIRDPDALERLVHAREVLFDKTGTLTNGELSVSATCFCGIDEQKGWQMVAALEHGSNHPVALALLSAAIRQIGSMQSRVSRPVTHHAGVVAEDSEGYVYSLGSIAWLQQIGIDFEARARDFITGVGLNQTLVGLACERKLVALFAIADAPRPSAAPLVEALQSSGLHIGILSGDRTAVVQSLGETLGIGDVRGELTPEEKALRVTRADTIFVGDGVNDALALAQAGVGIGISGGAAICLKVADIFITRPDLTLIDSLYKGARATINQVHRHLIISLCYNVTAITLAMSGYIGPLGAAIVMPLSSLSVIISAFYGAPFRRKNQ
jgi:Cu2+-exporting ATPase